MEKKQSLSSDRITVLVFKDHLSSRAFHLSLRWISIVGLVIGIITFFSIFGSALAIKYYRIASLSPSSHTEELEKEIEDLKAHLQKSESQSFAHPPQLSTSQNPEPSTNSQSPPGSAPPMALSIPTQIFPAQTQFLQSKQSELPIQVETPQFTWKNQFLAIDFALQYVKNDQGTHQGKIVILAQGKNTLLSYPEETLTFSTSPEHPVSLLHPNRGESYSLSRYRAVSASFGPLPSKKFIQTIEVFLFSKEGNQLLFHQSFPVVIKPSSPASHIEESQP